MNIAFIPARCGSKSIKFKNIKSFCGKPLIFWNLKALSNSKLIDEIVVATDCSKIEDIVLSFSFKNVLVYRRDKKNATDIASTESVLLEYLNKNKLDKKNNILIVQATSPLTESKDFTNAIIQFQNNKSDSMLTCVRKKHFVWNNNGPINYDFKNRPRRQDFDGILVENGAFYINSIENILKYGNRLSGVISIFEMEGYKYIELDEEDDWLIAEKFMYKYQLNKKKLFKNIKIFLTDVDGTLTDAGMYYSEKGDELKKFNTRDGLALELLKKNNIKVGIVTSETNKIIENRSKKLNVDFLYQGIKYAGKLNVVNKICKNEKISIDQVAYIGDDLNCFELLKSVGFAACPNDAAEKIKKIPNIKVMSKKGGEGAVREFVDLILA